VAEGGPETEGLPLRCNQRVEGRVVARQRVGKSFLIFYFSYMLVERSCGFSQWSSFCWWGGGEGGRSVLPVSDTSL
jgi:hypothetical protein